MRRILEQILLYSGYNLELSVSKYSSGAVMAVGSTRNPSAVRWGVAGNIVVAWLLTIPCAAGVAALIYGLLSVVGAV